MTFQKLILSILTVILVSCGSSERVITEDGTVYEVKGKKFFNKSKNVTDQLSSKDKENIKATLDKRLEAERLAEEKQEALENEQKRIEKTIEEAEKKQKALEEKQEQLEENLEAKEDARDAILKAKSRLQDKKEKYQKLKEAGKLSLRDEEKWNGRFSDLDGDIKEAMQALENLK
tara:strand:- start:53235 stop:53759 length:525 start_codon:yes stop_codon:yes gene_type:complete